jgi:hypothetical protein
MLKTVSDDTETYTILSCYFMILMGDDKLQKGAEWPYQFPSGTLVWCIHIRGNNSLKIKKMYIFWQNSFFHHLKICSIKHLKYEALFLLYNGGLLLDLCLVDFLIDSPTVLLMDIIFV